MMPQHHKSLFHTAETMVTRKTVQEWSQTCTLDSTNNKQQLTSNSPLYHCVIDIADVVLLRYSTIKVQHNTEPLLSRKHEDFSAFSCFISSWADDTIYRTDLVVSDQTVPMEMKRSDALSLPCIFYHGHELVHKPDVSSSLPHITKPLDFSHADNGFYRSNHTVYMVTQHPNFPLSPPVLYHDLIGYRTRPRLMVPPILTVPTVKIKELKLPPPKISTTCRLAVYHAHRILVSMDSVHNISRPVVRKLPSAMTRWSSNCLSAPALVRQHLDVLLPTTNNEFPNFGDTKRQHHLSSRPPHHRQHWFTFLPSLQVWVSVKTRIQVFLFGLVDDYWWILQQCLNMTAFKAWRMLLKIWSHHQTIPKTWSQNNKKC